MIQGAIATTTISPNRIVDADGSVKRDLVGSPGSAGLPPPVPVPVSTSSIATAVSVSLDMDLSFGGDHDRHSPHGLVGKAITHAGAVAAPRKQRSDTQHNHDCDHPAKCTTRAHGTTQARAAREPRVRPQSGSRCKGHVMECPPPRPWPSSKPPISTTSTPAS